ncbi:MULTISPECIES: MFS transporter [Bacillaceae]|uniref:MFS transporter n=1 Tax=Bacillaceae TaxID=186817 RepID=UPI000700C689|nr:MULTISPECIES: MFS transporter [Bacillaceae]KQL35052.1 permease [Psychrobacillus sp. FJAT-21963]MDF2065395.1 MFS transporter [Bacillus sp. Cr_A10]
MNKLYSSWKYPFILLVGIGISNLGAWVYLIALNLIVLDMTNSPLAVAGLYIVKPLATLFTNSWAGSVIDRINKRNLMIVLDLFRAMFIAFLPFVSDIWLIYSLVFIINMASSIFEPTSMTYVTKLIPIEQRKRFNSLRSLIDSGAFLIGPAIAGILFLLGTPTVAIFINATALLLSGIVTLFMPNLEKYQAIAQADDHFTWAVLKKDWSIVLNFSRHFPYIMIIYFLFSCVMVMATSLDSQEAAFAKSVLSLSNTEYGFLVSIAGAGIITGAIVNSIFLKMLRTFILIGVGSLFVSIGYIVYAFSSSFLVAGIGFFILAFSLAFANTGFHTFYQNNIPVNMMGRVGSIYGLIEAFFIILSTIVIGITAELVSIQFVVICGSLLMLALTVLLLFLSTAPSKREYYNE